MPWMIPAAIIGGSLFSADSASNAADTAARASGQASDASIAEQRRQFDIAQAAQLQARDQARADQAPFLAAGTGAVNQLSAGLQPGGRFSAAPQFNFDYNQNTDPGYGFRFDQGMRGLNASMAAKGLGVSGAGIKGAINYGQGMGSQEYQNAFNRYVTGFNANTSAQNTDFNRLSGLAGTGQTTANQIASQGINTASNLGTMGANMAGNIGNALMGSAANTGNAAMAGAGLRSSAYGGAANMLGRYYGGGSGSNPYGGAMAANMNPSNWGNVYGYGGGGYTPTEADINAAAAQGNIY